MFDTACASLVRLKSNLCSPRREEGVTFAYTTSEHHLLTSVATKHRARLVLILLGCLLSTTLRADDLPPLLGPAEKSAVAEALRCLKMTPADLSYKKDYAESPFRLGKVQRFLEQPLELPRYAQQAITEIAEIRTLDDIIRFCGREIGQVPFDGGSFIYESIVTKDATNSIPPPLRDSILRLIHRIELVTSPLGGAFPTFLSIEERQRATSRYAVENFRLAEDAPEITNLGKYGVPLDLLQNMTLLNEELRTEDDAYANDLLTIWSKITHKELITAAAYLAEGTDDAIRSLQAVDASTISLNAKLRIETRLGPIIIGGAGPTHYTAEDDNALLIIDLGGDDIYDCHIGAANGLINHPISICIDLGGNDAYRGGTLSQGAGVFGIGILVDYGGNDTYEGKHLCQGAGLYGVGIFADYGGNDSYTGDINCQGVGMFGVGILWDKAGHDHYVARECSQGYGYTGGLGLLLDGNGNDTYFAGGKYSDHERQPEHYLSLSQGFGNGMRSDASGGVGILCDLDGNDTYVADMFGQGASYWYSLGMLLDAKGNDTYRCHQYGQGTGIHLSLGILADWQGNDEYFGGNIVQGAAHDWSVGMLFDKEGNDTYIAKTTAQGAALYNSTALLVDSAGNDTYTTPKGANTQAAGHDGWTREYGTIAMLLDLGGKDSYSNGPHDDFIALKPLHGCALDVNESGRRFSAPTLIVPDYGDGRRTEAPPTFSNLTVFASTPTEISCPQNDDERRWFKLIRQSSQYEDTERKAKDKALARAILERDGAKVLPFWLRQCDHDAGAARFRLEEFVDSLGATNAAPALIDALRSPNELIRKSSIYFIGKLKVQGAVPALREQLPNEKLRAVSLWALGQVKAREAFLDALNYLNDTNEVVRIRATGTLGKLGDVRAVPKLIVALDDPLWDVRYSAQAALIKIGKPAVQPMLGALPKAGDRSRPYLIEALGKVGDWRTAKALRHYLSSASEIDRGTTVAAIATLNPSWTQAECKRLLKSETDTFVVSRLHDATQADHCQK